MCTLEGRRKTDEEVAAAGKKKKKKKKKKDGSSFVRRADRCGRQLYFPPSLSFLFSPPALSLCLSRPSPTSKEAAAREAGRV